MNKIDKLLIDLRDFAFLWEKKQTGLKAEDVDYKNKLLVLYGIYFIAFGGSVLYFIRAFYYIPYIKMFQQASYINRAFISIIFMYLPFRIFHQYLSKRYSSVSLPNDSISDEEYNRKKKTYWSAFIIGFLLIAFFAFIAVQIGSVVDGPIF